MTREEAIFHIKDVICENNTIKPNIVIFEQEKEALHMAIKALEQEPKWIPVSERLPEDDTRVLITTTSVLGTEHFVLEVSYLNGVFIRGLSCYTPSAWMPLPEPYKAESEDER